jgi:hypothetical protein
MEDVDLNAMRNNADELARRNKEERAKRRDDQERADERERLDAIRNVEEAEANRRSEYRAKLLIKLRLFLYSIAIVLAVLAVFFAMTPPELIAKLTENSRASSLAFSALALVTAVTLIGFFIPRKEEKHFADIDEKIYSAQMSLAEAEREQLLEKVRFLELELNKSHAGFSEVEDHTSFVDITSADLGFYRAATNSNNFDRYMRSLIQSLDMNIERSESKASLLLDKGTTYLWRGIVFYVLSIVFWQIASANFKLGEYALWGMISCSMTFLVVEFLAAWFLRQYKSFTDSSFNLVRVRSVFNRYFLSYLTIKEFSNTSEHLVDMRSQMLKVLEEDVKWLEPESQKSGDLNHMVAMFESVSGLVEKLKVSSKADTKSASS